MNKTFDFTKNKVKLLLLPIIIIVAGIVMYFVHGGFNFDVEFIGGTRMQVDLDKGFENAEVEKIVEDATGLDVIVQSGTKNSIAVIKLPAVKATEAEVPAVTEAPATETPATEAPVATEAPATEAPATETPASEAPADEAEEVAVAETEAPAENEVVSEEVAKAMDVNAQKAFAALQAKYNLKDSALISASNTDPSFGNEVQGKAVAFTLLAILFILIYIIFRFDLKSGVMAIFALVLNVLVMAAVYTITNIALNTTFIAAMLTVVGYSINNTIVIFDRIRENKRQRRRGESISEMTNRSIRETMGRTVNSTITTLITIVLIYILGVSTIKQFALPLIIGIIAGAYTSIFVASTFWAAWQEATAEAKAAAAKESKKK